MQIVRTWQCKFKQSWSRTRVILAALASAMLLAGCASPPQRSETAARLQQPLAKLVLPEAHDQDAAALVLAAEFALQHGDPKTAAADYAQAAASSNDPKIAQRAVELNLAVHDQAAAARSLDRWRTLGADPHQLASAQAQMAMLEGHRDEAQKEFSILLASGKPDDWRAFGGALLQARDTALAGAILETLAPPQRMPAEEGLWIAFSQLGEKLGKHAYARAMADAAVKRFGGEPSLIWDAQLELAGGDRAGARAMLARALAKHPKDTQLRLAYAGMLDTDSDAHGAQRVLAEGPQDTNTWAARIAFAARAKDTPLLVRLYAQLKQAPADVRDDSAFLLGQLAELLGKDQEALTWYGKVQADDEHAFDAQVRSALLIDKNGHARAAHDIAQRLQSDYADDADSLRKAYQLDAELYAKAGQFAQAAAAYSRGLHELPDDTELLYGRGLAEAQGGQNAAAVTDLRRLLTLKPDDIDAMNALGYTLADSNLDLGEATRLLSKALAAKPDQPAIIDSWGWLQYRLGHLDQAEQILRRAWGKSHDADIGVHLGEVLWKRGKRDEARAVFAQVRKLDPDNPDLHAALARLQP